MLTRYIIILWAILISFSTSAQNPAIVDSLKLVIEKAKHDTTLVSAYIALSNNLYISNIDTVIPLCLKAKKIAEQNLTKELPDRLRGVFLSSLADALNNMGVISDLKGETHQALDYYKQCLNVYQALSEATDPGIAREGKKGIATSLNNLGIIYNQQGDIPKALEYYHESLKIYEETENKKGIAMSLNNLAIVYSQQGEPSRALKYYYKSLKYLEALNNKAGVASTMSNIGTVYSKQGEYAKAFEYFKKSLDARVGIGDKDGIATALTNIAALWKKQGKINKALEYYQESLIIVYEIGDRDGIASISYHIGNIEYGLGELESAKINGIRGLEIGNEIGSPHLISMNSKLLARIAKHQSEYQQALEMYELHIQMRDSVKNDNTQKATIRQQTKYEFEKAQLVKEQEQKEAARLVAEETNRRDNLQYSVILLGLLVLGSLVLSLGKLSVSPRIAEGVIFFSFLIFFEFILVLADPYIDGWSSGAPGIKLLFNAGIAALIFPLHALFELKLKNRFVK